MRAHEFVREYLTPDEEAQVAQWKKRTPQATAATNHFFGGDDIEDIYEPLVDQSGKSEVHRAIEYDLGMPISSNDYKNGMIKDQSGKQIRIGSVIKDPKLRTAFKTDNTRKNVKANDLSVRTTRSASGVAGQTSHGQSWENASCKNFNTGINRHYLCHEVEHGTVVAYLKDKDGTELARATFHPYTNKEGNYLYQLDAIYGNPPPAFKTYVYQLEKRLSQPHQGDEKYDINPNVYNDSLRKQVTHPDVVSQQLSDPNLSDAALQNLIDNGNKSSEFLRAVLNHPNVNPEHSRMIIRRTDDQEILRDILRNEKLNGDDRVLNELSRKIRDPGLQKEMIAKYRDNPAVLRNIASNAREPSIRHLLIKLPNLNTEILEILARLGHNDDTFIRKIIQRPEVNHDVLQELSYHTNDPEIQKRILSNDPTGRALSNISARSKDPEIQKMIINNRLVTKLDFERILENTNDLGVIHAILNSKALSSFTLTDLLHYFDLTDPRIRQMIIDSPVADAHVLSNLLEKTPPESRTPELCNIAFKANPNVIRFIPDRYKTLDMCRIAIDKDKRNIQEVPTKFLKDKEISSYYLKRAKHLVQLTNDIESNIDHLKDLETIGFSDVDNDVRPTINFLARSSVGEKYLQTLLGNLMHIPGGAMTPEKKVAIDWFQSREANSLRQILLQALHNREHKNREKS